MCRRGGERIFEGAYSSVSDTPVFLEGEGAHNRGGIFEAGTYSNIYGTHV